MEEQETAAKELLLVQIKQQMVIDIFIIRYLMFIYFIFFDKCFLVLVYLFNRVC